MKSLLVLVLLLGICLAYDVPEATVKVLYPKGFEVSLPAEPGTTLFAFHGKLNAPMSYLSDQTWAVDVVEPRNGRWIYRNSIFKLNPGDVLYYWTTVRYHGLDYHNYNRRFVVPQEDGRRIDDQTNDGSNHFINIRGSGTLHIRCLA
ncbi:uncharacterized protein Dwil_GK20626 [Drosophila willistoni]|uniref:CBM39 domain-containing protein n=1 Tax=Drosophila willistoni TaxID=7260 RepID=B4MKF8_DROWI|nr:gram-negative bacteria-binding protein 3 [Drosophila willistoni]EDW72597.1 uncharacterized protein Dwil_GK20626 [Drosophila willistoni]